MNNSLHELLWEKICNVRHVFMQRGFLFFFLHPCYVFLKAYSLNFIHHSEIFLNDMKPYVNEVFKDSWL